MFSRASGQPLSEVLTWHPRDMDTWIAMEEDAAQEDRFARLREEHSQAMGRR